MKTAEIFEMIRKYNITLKEEKTFVLNFGEEPETEEEAQILAQASEEVYETIINKIREMEKSSESNLYYMMAPGLYRLEKAIREVRMWNDYNDQVGCKGGLIMLRECPHDLKALKKEYPKAACLVRANEIMQIGESVCDSRITNIAKEAKNRLIDGQNPETILWDLESKFHDIRMSNMRKEW